MAAKSKKSTPSKAEPDEGVEAQTASLSFEGALDQLETTVGRLEEGEMPLEEALKLFETGVTLSRQCSATLEAAEKRIEILVADRGGDRTQSFETDDLLEDDDEDSFGD